MVKNHMLDWSSFSKWGSIYLCILLPQARDVLEIHPFFYINTYSIKVIYPVPTPLETLWTNPCRPRDRTYPMQFVLEIQKFNPNKKPHMTRNRRRKNYRDCQLIKIEIGKKKKKPALQIPLTRVVLRYNQ